MFDLTFIEDAAKEECFKVAEKIASEAKSIAPVETGRLRDSIQARHTHDGAEITAVDYAKYVEYGHRTANGHGYVQGQHFFARAIEAVKKVS